MNYKAIDRIPNSPEIVWTPELARRFNRGGFAMEAIASNPETARLRAAMNEIRDILGQRQDRPWTTLSQIDQIARKALT